MSKPKILVFTDGSCVGNGTPTAIAGYGVYIPMLNISISKRLCGQQTNNRAELTAILEGLKIILKTCVGAEDVTIVSDSVYSINCVTKWIHNWKPLWRKSDGSAVLNKDLIQEIDMLLSSATMPIIFKHVAAHTKKQDELSHGNEIADKLANDGRHKGQLIHIELLFKNE